MDDLFTDQTFSQRSFASRPLAPGEYEDCRFGQCDFSGTALSGISFSGCSFVDCNLSLVPVNKTSLRDVAFTDCKMLGLHFDDVNPFGLQLKFQQCILDHSFFAGMKIKKTLFRDCSLKEVDFSHSDLTSSIFDQCVLTGARFEHCVLEKTDFRTALGFSIDPELNKMKKAKFSLNGLPGLLTRYQMDIDFH